MQRKVLLILCALWCGFIMLAQTVTVTGVVVDSSGDPLPGVSIHVKGNPSLGTSTNLEGQFSLKTDVGSSLVFSFVGCTSQEVAINAQNAPLHIVMEEADKTLDEVVVMGYGVQKKKLVTGATVQVKGEDVAKMNTVSPVGALATQTPGVQITSNSGAPGAGYKVTIRGLGTTGDAAPIVVIDGLMGGISNLEALNPNDIESIDILKDAASTAIYGARAANGVILVTTKKGSMGKATVTLDAYVGWQDAARLPQTLNAQEYAVIMNEARINDGLLPYTTEQWAQMVPNWDKIESGEWQGTDWVDEIMSKHALQQNYVLGVSGGNQMGNYAISIGYTSQESLMGSKYFDSNYERYTARISSEWSIAKARDFDYVQFGENLNLNMTETTGLGGGDNSGPYWNFLRWAVETWPFMTVYDEDGNFSKTLGSWSNLRANPVARMYYAAANANSKNYTARGNFYFNIQPIKGLIFRTAFGFGYGGWTSRSYSEEYDLGGSFQNLNNSTSQGSGNDYSWTWDNTLSYDFQIKQNHFTALVGMSAEKWGYGESVGATRQASTFGDWKHAYISNTEQQEATSTWSMWGNPSSPGRILSYFGRVNYDYANKYMATVTFRADGSSNFAKGHRWGYFPSVSAGWNISEESFMEASRSWLNFLKIRGSWGKNGNCSISNFQYLATIAIGGADYYFGDGDKEGKTLGSYPNKLANEDITWEKSEQLDFGFDARFLNSRLSVAFDWYDKRTKDWLVAAPILASYGTGNPYINGGDVKNTGVELALNWNDAPIRDFSYNVGVNLSYNRNKVTSLKNGEGIIYGSSDALSSQTDYISLVKVGEPMGFFYGYKTLGVFQNQEQVNAYRDANGNLIMPDAVPGDVIFADVNGDGVISSDDKTKIGDPHPDVYLGLNLGAFYKGFDFSISCLGAFGHQIAHSYRDFGDNPLDNYTMDIASARWHGEGTSNRYPRITASPNSNWKYISDIYVDDADYLRISNITLGYDFAKLFPHTPFSQLRLYVACNNLHTFTKYKGMDPEVGYGNGSNWAQGIDICSYPTPRTFLIGVNIKY